MESNESFNELIPLVESWLNVTNQIRSFKAAGIWLGRAFPKVGDIVVFNAGKAGLRQYISLVESVENNRIMISEDHATDSAIQSYLWSDHRIIGFARLDILF